MSVRMRKTTARNRQVTEKQEDAEDEIVPGNTEATSAINF